MKQKGSTEVEVSYDVRIPKACKITPNSKIFWGFYYSDHENVRLTYETVEQAVKVQRSFGMMAARNRIYNIQIKRRKNDVYLVRTRENEV